MSILRISNERLAAEARAKQRDAAAKLEAANAAVEAAELEARRLEEEVRPPSHRLNSILLCDAWRVLRQPSNLHP